MPRSPLPTHARTRRLPTRCLPSHSAAWRAAGARVRACARGAAHLRVPAHPRTARFCPFLPFLCRRFWASLGHGRPARPHDRASGRFKIPFCLPYIPPPHCSRRLTPEARSEPPQRLLRVPPTSVAAALHDLTRGQPCHRQYGDIDTGLVARRWRPYLMQLLASVVGRPV